jgi:large subunit ribosomal protein L3
VVQVKTVEKEGLDALQIGAGSRKPKQVSSPLAGHFKWAEVPIKRRLAQFTVTRDALLPVGTPLFASHLVAGQYVDVSGTSIGKGFAGGMKRWNFQGQGASHGNSVSHRAIGSTGNRQDPGKVFKGKKMPGRLGGTRCTVQSLLVYKVDAARGLVYVKGHVPGHSGSFIEVRDALREAPPATQPFPTYVEPQPGAAMQLPVEVAPKPEVNPFEVTQPERGLKKAAA